MSMNMNYKVVPIAGNLVIDVRNKLMSPQYKSLAASVGPATGYGPCRSCLRLFDQSRDHRIYFTYNSFEGWSALPDPGPVFIHLEECPAYDSDGFPPDLLDLPILLEAFDDESRLVAREPIDRSQLDAQIGDILSEPGVRFINLRNAEAGCFIAQVEPAEAKAL